MTGFLHGRLVALALGVAACGTPAEPALPPPHVLNGTGRAFLIDTRGAEAWRAGHSAVATPIPRSTPGFAARVVGLVENPDTPIYLYAASDEASAEAARVVSEEARRQRLPIPVSAAGSFEALAASGAPTARGDERLGETPERERGR